MPCGTALDDYNQMFIWKESCIPSEKLKNVYKEYRQIRLEVGKLNILTRYSFLSNKLQLF